MLDEEKDASAESEDALSDMELAMLIATASALLSAPIAHKAIRKNGRALLAKLQQIAGRTEKPLTKPSSMISEVASYATGLQI